MHARRSFAFAALLLLAADCALASTDTAPGRLTVWGGVGPQGAKMPADSPDRYHLWEVDLLPGTFRVQSEKLPQIDAARAELHYFTVAFHTPENVQFVIAYGVQRSRQPLFKDLLQSSSEPAKVSEVRRVHGDKDLPVRIIANDADGFTFTLKEKTRVFFAAEGRHRHKIDKCADRSRCLLPEWSPWRWSYENQVRPFPIFLRWRPEREAWQLEIECFHGDFDFRDWLITVRYLE